MKIVRSQWSVVSYDIFAVSLIALSLRFAFPPTLSGSQRSRALDI